MKKLILGLTFVFFFSCFPAINEVMAKDLNKSEIQKPKPGPKPKNQKRPKAPPKLKKPGKPKPLPKPKPPPKPKAPPNPRRFK